jgi:two-component system nitrate/nitrite response regulator NarL
MVSFFLGMKSQLLKDAVKLLLERAGLEVSGEAASFTETLDKLSQQPMRIADAIVIDARFCNDRPDAIRVLQEVSNGARIIILAYDTDVGCVTREQISIVDGILTFDISAVSMIHLLRLIESGERIVPRELMRSLFRHDERGTPGGSKNTRGGLATPAQSRSQAPSPREAEILHYLLRGDSNKMIARELGITEATVKVHLKGLLRKIGAGNRTQAAIWAMNNGFSLANFRKPPPRVLDPSGTATAGAADAASPKHGKSSVASPGETDRLLEQCVASGGKV